MNLEAITGQAQSKKLSDLAWPETTPHLGVEKKRGLTRYLKDNYD